MNLETGIYCPEILRSQILPSEARIVASLLGRREKPLISFEDKYAVRASLKGFANSINSSGIDSLINEYAKNGSNLAWEGSFIEPFFERGPNKHIHREGYFYMDGDYGFALGVKQQRSPLWLAMISFTTNNFYEGPTIVQLQSYTYETDTQTGEEGRGKALPFLQANHWEFFLVSLVGTWAQDIRIPAIYIIAGANNGHIGGRGLPLERAKMRYDVTARRLGFRKLPDGNYSLPLDYSHLDTEV